MSTFKLNKINHNQQDGLLIADSELTNSVEVLPKINLTPKKSINTITEILTDIRLGKMVILVDDEDRENEGDFIMAAEHITPAAINFMATHGRGLICLPLSESHCQKLGLAMMTANNLSSHRTAFTVSIEAAKGVTTGISATDRSHTIKTAVRKDACAEDIVQPGHIFPLKACNGGVLTRAGHTEAACDLASLAGLSPAGVICEILNPDGSMARLDDLLVFAGVHNIKIGTIADLIAYRMTSEMLVENCANEKINIFGTEFKLHIFKDTSNNQHHIAISYGIGGNNKFNSADEVLVRVHHPLTNFDFMLANFNNQTHYKLIDCLKAIVNNGCGVLVGLCSENSDQVKISELINQIKAKTAPEKTSKAKWDPKLYGTGAQIIRALGISRMRLLSHPINLANIKGFGLEISEFVNLDTN